MQEADLDQRDESVAVLAMQFSTHIEAAIIQRPRRDQWTLLLGVNEAFCSLNRITRNGGTVSKSDVIGIAADGAACLCLLAERYEPEGD